MPAIKKHVHIYIAIVLRMYSDTGLQGRGSYIEESSDTIALHENSYSASGETFEETSLDLIATISGERLMVKYDQSR